MGICEYVCEVANMYISARNNIPGVETACMEQEVGKESVSVDTVFFQDFSSHLFGLSHFQVAQLV